MQASVEKLYEKRAIYYGEKAFRLNPTLHPSLASILGKLYLRDGQYDKSIECFNFFIAKYPNQRSKVDENLGIRHRWQESLRANPLALFPKIWVIALTQSLTTTGLAYREMEMFL